LKDIPKEVLKELKVILVDHVDQVLINALDIKNPREVFKVQKEEDMGVRAQYAGQSIAPH
jgi:ATP-dependent Lon protease